MPSFFAVKSFGTEDRVSDNVVPERNEIYEYIVFRGSDIDDLHVSEGPKSRGQVAQDPAIVQVNFICPAIFMTVTMPSKSLEWYSWADFVSSQEQC